MWRRLFSRPPRPSLARLLAGAESEARWEALDLVSRRDPEAAVDLLRGHAAELASSALGRDQLLSLALDQAADDLAAGRRPQPDLSGFRREEVLDAAAVDRIRGAALSGGSVGRDAADEFLAGRLWSDPRIPADEACRARMLGSLPRSPRAKTRAGPEGRRD